LLAVDENSGPGVVAGTLRGLDQDVNDTLSWFIVSTTPSKIADVIELDESSGEVAVSSGAFSYPEVLNFEDLAGFGRSLAGVATLLIELRDSGGNTRDASSRMSTYANVSFTVRDVPEPPFFYLQDSDELAPFGSIVANVSVEEN